MSRRWNCHLHGHKLSKMPRRDRINDRIFYRHCRCCPHIAAFQVVIDLKNQTYNVVKLKFTRDYDLRNDVVSSE